MAKFSNSILRTSVRLPHERQKRPNVSRVRTQGQWQAVMGSAPWTGQNFVHDRGPASQASSLSQGIIGQQRRAEILAVLTNEQREKWDRMLGAILEFPYARPAAPTALDVRLRSGRFVVGQIRPAFLKSGVPIAWTARGPACPFLYRSIIDELELSAEQISEIQTIGTEDAEAVGAIDLAAEDSKAKLEAIDVATQQKLDKVLTQEQRNKLKDLVYE